MSNESEKVADKPSEQSVVHTPGPWELGNVYELSPSGRCRQIVAEDGKVCLVYGIEDADCKANAKLIAAAPELLTALQRIRDDLIREYSPYVYDVNFKYIDEAIAKVV